MQGDRVSGFSSASECKVKGEEEEMAGGEEEDLMETGVTGLVSNRTCLWCSLQTALSLLSAPHRDVQFVRATQRCDLTSRRIPSDFYHL